MTRALLGDLLRTPPQGQRMHASPFLVLGDPTPRISLELAIVAAEEGAAMLELGLAYDDPCADGPAIAAAGQRARNSGITTDGAFELMAELRARLPNVAFNLLVYGNLVHARGLDRFCRDATDAGASSLLVPDIPLEESGALRDACASAALGHVLMAGPHTTKARLRAISSASDAFVYLAARQSVTGKHTATATTRYEFVQSAAGIAQAPLCVGFGLSTAADLRETAAAGARIAVVGSHLARCIAAAWSPDTLEGTATIAAFRSAWRALNETDHNQTENEACS